MEEVKRAYRVDLVEADEDKLDDLLQRLARRKKTQPIPSVNRPAPIKGTPAPVTSLTATLTNFKVHEIIRSKNNPDWGTGIVTRIERFAIAADTFQKLYVVWDNVGKKVVVAMKADMFFTATVKVQV